MMRTTLRALVSLMVMVTCFFWGWAGHRWMVSRSAVIGDDARIQLYFWNYDPVPASAAVRDASTQLLNYLNTSDPAFLQPAQVILETGMPRELLGSPAPALLWLCKYFSAQRDGQQQMLENPDGARLLLYFSARHFEPLVDLLQAESRSVAGRPAFHLSPQAQVAFDLLTRGSPTRAREDAADDVVSALGLRPGSAVADLRARIGFWLWRFARAVGPKGVVYAVEDGSTDLDYVRGEAAREGLVNLRTVPTRLDDVSLPPASIDCGFVCSYYHYLYGHDPLAVRANWVNSVRRALRPHGTLAVVDNVPEVRGAPPYIGDRISRYVIIADLRSRGFHLMRTWQFTPQRYLLIFEKGDSPLFTRGGRSESPLARFLLLRRWPIKEGS